MVYLLVKGIPIFKKKDKSLAANYRPISLLSIFNNLLDKGTQDYIPF